MQVTCGARPGYNISVSSQSGFRLLALLLIGLSAALCAAETQAQEIHIDVPSKQFDRCMDSGYARMGATSAMLDCWSDEIDHRDKVLNEAYRSLARTLPSVQRRQLQTSERLWIAKREEICLKAAREDPDAGASLGRFAYPSCILNETNKRILWLKYFPRPR